MSDGEQRIAKVNVQARLTDLITSVGAFEDSVAGHASTTLDPADLAERFGEVESALDALRGELEIASSRARSEDFLEGMVHSMVRVRGKLDEENRRTLERVRADPNHDPSLLRMPRMTAELRFALEKVSKEGWDVLVYSSGSEARELNQQTLTAEIVSVPPTPEMIAATRHRAPVSLVLDPDLRSALLAVVRAHAEPRHRDLLVESWPRVVVLREEPGGTFLLLFTKGDDSEKDLGILGAVLDPPVVTVALSWFRAANPSETTAGVRRFVASLADWQEAWFALSGGTGRDA